MYQNIFVKTNTKEAWVWDDDKGLLYFNYTPYAYRKDSNGKFVSLYGDKLSKVTEFTKTVETKDAAITELTGKLAASDQKVADLNAKIVNLTTDAGPAPEVGAAASNGTGAEQPKLVVGAPAYDHSKSSIKNFPLS